MSITTIFAHQFQNLPDVIRQPGLQAKRVTIQTNPYPFPPGSPAAAPDSPAMGAARAYPRMVTTTSC